MGSLSKYAEPRPMPVPINRKGFALMHKNAEEAGQEVEINAELERMVLCYESARAVLFPRPIMRKGVRHILWEVTFPNASRYEPGPLCDSPAEAMARNYLLNNAFPLLHANAASGNKDAVGLVLLPSSKH